MKKLLIINAGSSSIKYEISEFETLKTIAKGQCERIFAGGIFSIKSDKFNDEFETNFPDHLVACQTIVDQLKRNNFISDIKEIVGVAHRVVHGGTDFSSSCVIDDKVIAAIEKNARLAPLHNPPQVKVIKKFEQLLPGVTNVAIFDTSFHTTMPQVSYDYSLDRELTSKFDIRKYGMHGSSYRFITERMQEHLGKSKVNLVVCHIGNGASMCAIKDSKSYDTTMGLTPLDGLVMGTRCGAIDPSTALYLIRQGLSVDEVEKELNNKAGLKGLTGFSDNRDVTAAANKGDKTCVVAREIQINKIVNYLVQYLNSIGNVDAIVFTAGIGENDSTLPTEVMEKVKLLKLIPNKKALSTKYDDIQLISESNSDIDVYRIRTNEEYMMLKDTKSFCK